MNSTRSNSPGCKSTVGTAVQSAPRYAASERLRTYVRALYNNTERCLQSFSFRISREIAGKLKRSLRGLRLPFIFPASMVQTCACSAPRRARDSHRGERGTGRALRAGSAPGEGRGRKKSGWNPDRRAQRSVDHCV